jgi:hypothetical protein
MADMYGAMRSNWFKVKDPEAFRAWMRANVNFNGGYEIWIEDEGVAIGSETQYPNAWPNTLPACDLPEEHPDYDPYDGDTDAWDLEEFAAEIRKHLEPGEEFRVLAAGNEKLRYVSATHLIVTHDTAEFHNYYEGN